VVIATPSVVVGASIATVVGRDNIWGSSGANAGGRRSFLVTADDLPFDRRGHRHPQKAEMGLLRDSLRLRGISGFVAHTDIEPTQEWQDVIESALETCDALAAYMTDDFHKSKWTDQEVGFCVGRAILIIPIKVGLDPYGFIGKYQALNGIGKPPIALADEIAGVVTAHPLTASKMVVPTVTTFANSYSFDNARANLERLQHIPDSAWTPELVELVERQLEDNVDLAQGVARTPSGWRSIPDIVREKFKTLGLGSRITF
jgi:hypothetical protein